MNNDATGNSFFYNISGTIHFGTLDSLSLKIGIGLWLLAAAAGLCTLQLGKTNDASMINSQKSSVARSLLYRPSPTANWQPRTDCQNQVGALSDLSCTRVADSTDLQNVLDERPLGSDIPYRQQ